MECVNYKYCDLIGTPKFLPLAQECCRFSPDPSPSGGVWARDYPSKAGAESRLLRQGILL